MREEAINLCRKLEAAGFFAAYSLLGDGNFRPYDWEKMAGQLPEDTQALWRFFLLGSRLSEGEARRLLGEPALAFLDEHKLCCRADGGMNLGYLSLISYRGATFFVERTATPRSYFGEDTKALMSMVPRLEKGKCLCLYGRSGAAVLPLASHSPVETTFSRGRYSREVLKANLLLNQAQASPRFLSSPSAETRASYDVVIAAPPSTFEPPGIKMPEPIGGGRDGLKHVRDVLRRSKKLLSPEGVLIMTFMFFSKAESKDMRERLGAVLEKYDLSYSLMICSRHSMQPGVPVFNMMFSLATSGKPAAAEAVAKRMMHHVKTMKFEAAYLVKGRFSLTPRPARREIIDYSDLYYGSWTF
jgi:hypothetical protein